MKRPLGRPSSKKKAVVKQGSILANLTRRPAMNTDTTRDHCNNQVANENNKCFLSMGYEADEYDENNKRLNNKSEINSVLANKTIAIKEPELDKKELLRNNIIKYVNEDRELGKKVRKNRDLKKSKIVMVESVNKIKDKEYVITATELQEDNSVYYYDQYKNIVDNKKNIIGVYRDKKAHLLSTEDE
jgi:hypothetical protein